MEFTAEMIAAFLSAEIVGDKNIKVWTVAKIEDAGEGSLCFLSNMKYEHFLYETGASIAIVDKDFIPAHEVKPTLIKVSDPYGAFAKLLELYAANKPRKNGISPLSSVDVTAEVGEGCYVGEFAVICSGAKIGKGSRIYPNAYIGDNVKIGENALIYPSAVVNEDCVLGNNVTLHSGCVIGGDGFGFAPDKEGHYSKIPQIGNVVLEDDVDVGANTCIDRATMGSTVIKRGTKLDNLIQIAHNVTIGSDTVIASQVGIAGSTKVGNNCMVGGQVGIIGHLIIGDRVQLASKTGILDNVADGEVRFGYPSMPGRQFQRTSVVLRRLPEMSNKLDKMEKELAALKALLADHQSAK